MELSNPRVKSQLVTTTFIDPTPGNLYPFGGDGSRGGNGGILLNQQFKAIVGIQHFLLVPGNPFLALANPITLATSYLRIVFTDFHVSLPVQSTTGAFFVKQQQSLKSNPRDKGRMLSVVRPADVDQTIGPKTPNAPTAPGVRQKVKTKKTKQSMNIIGSCFCELTDENRMIQGYFVIPENLSYAGIYKIVTCIAGLVDDPNFVNPYS